MSIVLEARGWEEGGGVSRSKHNIHMHSVYAHEFAFTELQIATAVEGRFWVTQTFAPLSTCNLIRMRGSSN